MAFSQDDVCVSHQLVVGEGFPENVLKTGNEKVRGTASFEGPVVIGSPDSWERQSATVMIGPDTNSDSDGPQLNDPIVVCGELINNSPYSLHVVGDARVDDNLDIKRNVSLGGKINSRGKIESQDDVTSYCGLHKLSLKKNFDIPHPTKSGWRLRHTCTEAPYNDVYIRGKLKHSDEIFLPEYWKNFVDVDSITVHLTPIGSHQEIMVVDVNEKRIKLSGNYDNPIHCYYQVFASRSDGDKLIAEYQGWSPNDYPGNNNEYLINQ